MIRWIHSMFRGLRVAILLLLAANLVAEDAGAQTNTQNTAYTVTAPWSFAAGQFILGSSSGCLQAASGVVSVLGANCGTGGVTVGATITGTCPSGYMLYSNSGAIGCQVVSGAATNSVGFPNYITGASMFYPNPYFSGQYSTSAAGVANSYYCAPFWVFQSVTIKGLGLRVIATSTGNSSAALQGAIYSNLVTTGNLNRPGTLIDYTASFATGVATTVSAAMNNGTDALTGPGLFWTCVQKFDATATYMAFGGTNIGSLVGAAIGSATLVNVLGTFNINSVAATGSAYGGTNWVNFTSSTSWVEAVGTILGPVMAIEVN